MIRCHLMECYVELTVFLFSVESSITVNGITGENVTVNLKFKDLGISSLPNMPILHKNYKKLGICKQTSKHCFERFILSNVDDNSTATLYIINITLEDEGRYRVALDFDGAKPLVYSNEITFTVKTRNTTNGRYSHVVLSKH